MVNLYFIFRKPIHKQLRNNEIWTWNIVNVKNFHHQLESHLKTTVRFELATLTIKIGAPKNDLSKIIQNTIDHPWQI